jgi:hypothetical protein
MIGAAAHFGRATGTDLGVLVPIGTDPDKRSVPQKHRRIRHFLRAGTDGTDLFKVSPVTRALGDKLKTGSHRYHRYHRSDDGNNDRWRT